MDDKFCLLAQYKGEKVVFTEEQRVLKSSNRPELRDNEFIQGRLKRAIENPTFIYQDLAHPKDRQVHYLEEYSVNNKKRYTKVVILLVSNPLFVVTAFRPDYVKERGKTKLLYGTDR